MKAVRLDDSGLYAGRGKYKIMPVVDKIAYMKKGGKTKRTQVTVNKNKNRNSAVAKVNVNINTKNTRRRRRAVRNTTKTTGNPTVGGVYGGYGVQTVPVYSSNPSIQPSTGSLDMMDMMRHLYLQQNIEKQSNDLIKHNVIDKIQNKGAGLEEKEREQKIQNNTLPAVIPKYQIYQKIMYRMIYYQRSGTMI